MFDLIYYKKYIIIFLEGSWEGKKKQLFFQNNLLPNMHFFMYEGKKKLANNRPEEKEKHFNAFKI